MYRNFLKFKYVKINITIFQVIKRRQNSKNRKKRKISLTLIKKLQIVVNKHKTKKTTKKQKDNVMLTK